MNARRRRLAAGATMAKPFNCIEILANKCAAKFVNKSTSQPGRLLAKKSAFLHPLSRLSRPDSPYIFVYHLCICDPRISQPTHATIFFDIFISIYSKNNSRTLEWKKAVGRNGKRLTRSRRAAKHSRSWSGLVSHVEPLNVTSSIRPVCARRSCPVGL